MIIHESFGCQNPMLFSFNTKNSAWRRNFWIWLIIEIICGIMNTVFHHSISIEIHTVHPQLWFAISKPNFYYEHTYLNCRKKTRIARGKKWIVIISIYFKGKIHFKMTLIKKNVKQSICFLSIVWPTFLENCRTHARSFCKFICLTLATKIMWFWLWPRFTSIGRRIKYRFFYFWFIYPFHQQQQH